MVQADSRTANEVIPGRRDSYTIINLVGRGGMGAVYRARRASDNTLWALKEMRPATDLPPEEAAENRKLFTQEAELLSKLSHPNLPVIADYFEYQGRPVLVMEFVPGQTLEARIHDANAPLLEQQVLGYGIQLCRVLHYLHSQNPPVIYRDLKPSNAIVTPEGVLKLIDFGVARTHKRGKSKDTVAMGSAGYAPPEQYGKEQTDARSDIYALGATLLHLLTNLPPVPLQTPQPGYIRKLNPSVDANTEAVIIKAMQIKRDERFPTCAAMEQALLRCLDMPYVDPTTRAAPPPPAFAPQPASPPAPVPAVPAQPVPVQPAPATAPAANNLPWSIPANNPAPGPTPHLPPAARGQSQQPPANNLPWPNGIPPAGRSASAAPAQLPTQAAPVPLPIADGVTCLNCGRVNKARARFCAGCGKPLAGPPVARLSIRSPRGSWEIKLERMPCRIGRRDPRQHHYPEVDLAEYDRGIASRNHATIQRDGDFYSLVDLGSTNGTQLNGVAVPARVPQRLRQGDRIKIGEVEMTFQWSQ
ncbi:MAG: protein kinase [Chloroflexaceae bacterium]|jgi:serine/threonine protein kinase|nr:protein kinase [Chloroflexaceae bacterium]